MELILSLISCTIFIKCTLAPFDRIFQIALIKDFQKSISNTDIV